MSLLLHNYPPHFITKQFHRFFQFNGVISVLHGMNEQVYFRLHQTLLHQPIRREKQLQTMTQDPVRAPATLQQKAWDRQLMFQRYLVDSALTKTFQTQFTKCWRE